MTIAAAARATRKYARCLDGPTPSIIKTETMEYTSFETEDDAQATCDRLNLVAVLEAIRDPSEGMEKAALLRYPNLGNGDVASIWYAMIDALIAEVRPETMNTMSGRSVGSHLCGVEGSIPRPGK